METITIHKKFTSQEQANAHVASVCENAQKTDIGSGEYLFENNRVSGWLFFNHNEKNEKVWNVKYSNF